MSILGSIFTRANLFGGIAGGVVSVVGFLIAFNQGSVDKAVSETSAMTSLQERLASQQRQLDTLERRLSGAVADVKKEQEVLRKEALVHGSERNKVAMQEFAKRLEALTVKIETLPKTAGGGVDSVALNKAIEQVKLDLSGEFQKWLAARPQASGGGVSMAQVQQMLTAFEGQLASKIAPVVEEKMASLPSPTGDGIPIATKRRIHFVEKDCVYLQSMPKQFTLKFRSGQEFCWKPSVLWFDITSIGSSRFEYRYVGGKSYSCSRGSTCYLGSEEDGMRYRIQPENFYEKDGIRYAEVNFLKVD
ncbi:hypothetical protein [Aliiroseovarius crassostreae]|uniref:hypothetical protein n=1 Tax=Aliiroseovarius crassostreae TaxID=154981 RepID=UPI003C7C36EA